MRFFSCLLFIVFFVINNANAVSVGDQVPDCKLSDLNNTSDTLNLNKFKGEMVYVDFWASWCAPCAKSFPYMNHLHNLLKSKGFNIIAVNLDEAMDEANDFLTKLPADFTAVYDQEQQCAKSFGVQAMPSTYLVDKKGIIRHIHLGFKRREVNELELMIDKLLAEQL